MKNAIVNETCTIENRRDFDFLDHVPIGMLVLRKDLGVLFWNRCLEDWTGLSRDDVVGMNLKVLFPHLDNPQYIGRFEGIFEGGPPAVFSSLLHQYIIPAPLPDGQFRVQHTTVTAIPASDETSFYALFAIQDVTDLTRRVREYWVVRDQALEEAEERKRAEKALREYSEQLEDLVSERTVEIQAQYAQLDAILHSVGDAILMADQEMRIRYVNPAFAALTGYTLKELLGQDARSVEATTGSGQVLQSIESTAAEDNVWQGEVIFRRKDGRMYDAALTVAPMRDAEGRLTGYVSSHHDISQSKDLERARSQFITNISHQFRTPITTLQLYAHLMWQAELSEKHQHHLQTIENQIAWLAQLIQDALEITALDSGKAVTAWEAIPLPILVEDTITRYQDRAKAAGLGLENMPIPSDLPVIKGDLGRLSQALGEIIENAIIFTLSGGQVTLKVRAVEEKDRVWVTIAVQDTGPGISPEEQEKVFDRFFRGELADSGHVPGTGLGLSIADEIARAQGGRITIESQIGEGSTFIIWLPSIE
ncbi:MAG: PAS domain S-box protein [Chloroflexi bacterium]|nr:PAS domain S-box protein [Chloroflexota bacterium]